MDPHSETPDIDFVAIIGDEIYSALLQLSPDAIALLSPAPHLTYLMANPRAVQMHGYDSLDEMVGRPGTDFIHPDEIPLINERLALLKEQGIVSNMGMQLLRRDGSSFPADLNASLVRNKDGSPRFIIIIARDISEQRRLETELREREARLRGVIGTSRDGYIQIGLDGRIQEVNDAYCRMVGYSRDELLAMSVRQIEVAESPEAIRQRIERVLTTGSDLFRAHHRHKNGSVVIIEACMNHDPSVGELLFGFLRDITERTSQERELHIRDLAIHSSLSGMAMVGLDKRLTYVNPSFLQIWGYDSAEEVLGRSTGEFWERPEECEAVMTAVVKQGSWTGTLRGRRGNGTIFPVEVRVSLVKDKDGTPLCSMSTFIDITERQKAEEENRRLHAELEQRVEERTAQLAQSNRELESFCYSVSHDLRTPLRAIASFGAILREQCEGKLDEEGEEALFRIERGANRMGELIDDLLALSRVSRHEMALQQVDMSALCDEILEQLSSAHPGRAVDVRISRGVQVMADPVLLRQVLHNLLENAWKYTSRTSGAVIEFNCHEENGAQVCSISDNGAGFDMAYADKLFGTFQRLHGIEEFEGTGIGLATVKRAIERHGGRVWGEGEPGKGAVFSFAIPINGERVAPPPPVSNGDPS